MNKTKILLFGIGSMLAVVGFAFSTLRADMDSIQGKYITTIDGTYTQRFIKLQQQATLDQDLASQDKKPAEETTPSPKVEGRYMYGDKGPKVPLYLQGDPVWGAYWPSGLAGGINIASSGCGYTSLAMAISYLTEQEITPQKILEDGAGKYHTSNSGIGWGAFTGVPPVYGCIGRDAGMNWDLIDTELRSGKVAVASIVPGVEPDRFSTGGHIICIRGVTDEGNYLINNPNARGEAQLNMEYSRQKMNSYVKHVWTIGKE